MQNLVIPTTELVALEQLFNEARALKLQIATLEKQYADLKKQLIATYYERYQQDKFVSHGVIFATYATTTRIAFKQAQFKQDEPKLFEKYLDIQEVRTFLIK